MSPMKPRHSDEDVEFRHALWFLDSRSPDTQSIPARPGDRKSSEGRRRPPSTRIHALTPATTRRRGEAGSSATVQLALGRFEVVT